MTSSDDRGPESPAVREWSNRARDGEGAMEAFAQRTGVRPSCTWPASGD